MPYIITPRTHALAAKLGVNVRPSTTKGKKLDVIKNGQRIHSIGAIGYADYATFLQQEEMGIVPKGTSRKRQRAYKNRHASNRTKRGSAGWYADQLLWS
jgi:hypothetical protein